MDFWQFAGSLLAVALLVLMAWKYGYSGRPELLGEEDARALASEVPGGFDAAQVALDRSRGAALLRDAKGRVVLVAPAGAHFVARLLVGAAEVSTSDGVLTIRDAGGLTALDLGSETDDWAKAISRLE